MALGYLRKINGVDIYSPITVGTISVGLTTSESLLGSLQVNGSPANYLTDNDIMFIDVRASRTTSLGTASVILRLGPNQSVVDNQIGIFTSPTGFPNAWNIHPITRIVKTNGTQSFVFGATTSQIAYSGNLSKTTMNLDFTSNTPYYLTVWCQMSGANATMSISYLSCKIIRSNDGTTTA